MAHVGEMEMDKDALKYEILDECKCGPEEFFVLVSSVEDDDVDAFLGVLVDLVDGGLLYCRRRHEAVVRLTLADLKLYVAIRREAGEELDEMPNGACTEYDFTSTDKGIGVLRPEDRPVPLSDAERHN